jgi:hypothetical protein
MVFQLSEPCGLTVRLVLLYLLCLNRLVIPPEAVALSCDTHDESRRPESSDRIERPTLSTVPKCIQTSNLPNLQYGEGFMGAKPEDRHRL